MRFVPRFGAGASPLLPSLVLTLLAALVGIRSFAADGRTDPGAALEGAVSRPCFAHATWGAVVIDCASGRTLFETNAHSLLKPASNAKLFTAALALDALGPDFRIPTDILLRGRINRHGTLRGDVVIVGHGDFSLAARFADGDASRSLTRVVDAISGAGVRRITGDLIGDDAFFSGPPFGNGWTWDDLQYYYGAEVSALTTDDNVVDLVFRPGHSAGDPVTLEVRPDTDYLTFDTRQVRTVAAEAERRILLKRDPGSRHVTCRGSLPAGGEPWIDSISVPEPALFFVHHLRECLERQGIRVRGRIRHSHPDGEGRHAQVPRETRLAVQSPPLRDLLPFLLKPSQNLYAQLLLLQVGSRSEKSSTEETTEAMGLRALCEFVPRAGLAPEEVLLDDGSGLSRSSLVTPAALVGILRFMDRHRDRVCFLDALPLAGVDGTLRRRFKGTDCEGNLRAKTGSLRYVNTLSGFVTNRAGRRIVFATMLNAYDPPAGAPSGREAVDEFARLLGESRAGGPP